MTQTNDTIFCTKCGERNLNSNTNCSKCNATLSIPKNIQYVCTSDNTLGGLIPNNTNALVAYYTGIFSLIPFVGIFLGIAALIFGILGIKFANKNPQAKGKIHAWVGIILGGLFSFIYIAIIITSIVMAFIS
jgi:ribosomal protein L40E